jgi:type IV pilus assembly protein PilV
MNLARNRCAKEQGFTIIEVLLAISILAIGLLAVATMQLSAIRVNSTANKVTTRATYAQDRLERLNALPYTHALLTDNDADVGDATTYFDFDPNPPADILVTYTVDDNNPIQGTKRIVLTVTEASGSSVTLVTVRSSNI